MNCHADALAAPLLLLALVEGTSRDVEERMLGVLDVKRLAEVAGLLYERGPMAGSPPGPVPGAGEYQRLRWHAFPVPS